MAAPFAVHTSLASTLPTRRSYIHAACRLIVSRRRYSHASCLASHTIEMPPCVAEVLSRNQPIALHAEKTATGYGCSGISTDVERAHTASSSVAFTTHPVDNLLDGTIPHPEKQSAISDTSRPTNSTTVAAMAMCSAAATTTAPHAERIESIKMRLVALRTRKAELECELKQMQENLRVEHDALKAEMMSAESELDVLVNVPLAGSCDPTEWLPDEIVVMILAMLPPETLWSGACKRVCRRWNRLVHSESIKRRKREGRWTAYEAKVIAPQLIEGHTAMVRSIAVLPNGAICTASYDTTIRIHETRRRDGARTQRLLCRGHSDVIYSVAVGADGKIYSGGEDRVVQVWCSHCSDVLYTLEGHTDAVKVIAVGPNAKVYSGSHDSTVRVWSGATGEYLQTLVGHKSSVWALAVGLDGKLYSGSNDSSIRVWSGDSGALLRTLAGHMGTVYTLAIGPDGNVYTGGEDKLVHVWSSKDGRRLKTLAGHEGVVWSLAVGSDGKVYTGGEDRRICVWSGSDGTLLHTLEGHVDSVRALAVGPDGLLYSGSRRHGLGHVLVW